MMAEPQLLTTETAESSPSVPREPIWTRNFNLTWLASFFGYASYYFMLSTMPLYVKSVGGTEFQVGLVVGTFSAVSLLVRAPMGNACDKRGPRLFMMAGAVLLAVTGGVYFLCRTVNSLIFARALHGVGWAFFGTSVYSQVADLAPAARRGEAMGYYGISCNLAMALGPALGFFLLSRRGGNFTPVFALSSTSALIALCMAFLIAAPQKPKTKSGENDGGKPLNAGHFFEPSAILPAFVMGLAGISYSAAISFVPIFAKSGGVENPGFFFTVYAIALVVSRTFTGRLSDIFGRAAVIVPGLIFIALSLMAAAPFASTNFLVALTGALFGFGFSTAQSSIMALVADRAPEGRRGAAMGTYMTAMDLGIGLGALICGALSDAFGFRTMFLISGAFSLLGAVVFLSGKFRMRRSEKM